MTSVSENFAMHGLMNALFFPRFRRSGDPYLLLRAVLPRESVLLDPAMQVHVRFRLGGPRQGSYLKRSQKI